MAVHLILMSHPHSQTCLHQITVTAASPAGSGVREYALNDAAILAAAASETAAAVADAVAHPDANNFGYDANGSLAQLPVTWTKAPQPAGACDAGYYADGPLCRRCPQGYVRAEGHDRCQICLPGSFADVERQVCAQCTPGNYAYCELGAVVDGGCGGFQVGLLH